MDSENLIFFNISYLWNLRDLSKMKISPSEGVISPINIARKVVFPAPFFLKLQRFRHMVNLLKHY